jgi:hypothetical protein
MQAKAEKEARELEGCTFAPVMATKARKSADPRRIKVEPKKAI